MWKHKRVFGETRENFISVFCSFKELRLYLDIIIFKQRASKWHIVLCCTVMEMVGMLEGRLSCFLSLVKTLLENYRCLLYEESFHSLKKMRWGLQLFPSSSHIWPRDQVTKPCMGMHWSQPYPPVIIKGNKQNFLEFRSGKAVGVKGVSYLRFFSFFNISYIGKRGFEHTTV